MAIDETVLFCGRRHTPAGSSLDGFVLRLALGKWETVLLPTPLAIEGSF